MVKILFCVKHFKDILKNKILLKIYEYCNKVNSILDAKFKCLQGIGSLEIKTRPQGPLLLKLD